MIGRLGDDLGRANQVQAGARACDGAESIAHDDRVVAEVGRPDVGHDQRGVCRSNQFPIKKVPLIVEWFRAVGLDKEAHGSTQIHQLVARLPDNPRQQRRRSAGDRITTDSVAQRHGVLVLAGCRKICHCQRRVGLTRQVEAVETPLIEHRSGNIGRDAEHRVCSPGGFLQPCLNCHVRLSDGQKLFHRDIEDLLHDARRPFDADGVDDGGVAQAEMRPGTVARVAVAVRHDAHLPVALATDGCF